MFETAPEKEEDDIMRRTPRAPDEPLLSRDRLLQFSDKAVRASPPWKASRRCGNPWPQGRRAVSP